MDNRVFNVNGSGFGMFVATLKLAMWQADGCYDFKNGEIPDVQGYFFEPSKGLILFSYGTESTPGATKFLTPMTADEVAPMLYKWLESAEAKAMHFDDRWDGDCDHDGSNSKGWRMFVEDWGKVGGHWGVAVCIRPAYMWHGK